MKKKHVSGLPTDRNLSRFIDIRKLERESRPLLFIGLCVAVIFHGLLAVFWHHDSFLSVTREAEEHRIIKLELRPIPPQPTAPYVLERPEIQQREISRLHSENAIPGGTPSVKKPLPFGLLMDRYSVNADSVILGVMRDAMRTKEILGFNDLARIIVERMYEDLTISREPKGTARRFSLREDLLRIEDFDFGEYKSLVMLDAEDKKNIRGFGYVPTAVWGATLRPPDSLKRAMTGLIEAVEKHTPLKMHIDKHVNLSEERLLSYPFIYIAADDLFDLTEVERKNFAKYLHSGGFAFIEGYGRYASNEMTTNTAASLEPDRNPVDGTGIMTKDLPPKGSLALKAMLSDALGAEGHLYTIPSDHELYYSYFDITELPYISRIGSDITRIQHPKFLEGAWVDGRLAVVYSEKDFGLEWSKTVRAPAFDKIAVNLLVYALIHKGGSGYLFIDDKGIVQ